ncbi:hypothetical protein AO364_0115 [Moraxella catarrhalis]|nr:hypothetical protein AO380_1038 [Moraxella catarrhalis]OAV23793.1 hypothetical protein AO371_1284 [Moraxella catarrhalis]OAV31306.1 hypothetical protein AO367_0586 [Moraxella catarrhalis]OAV37970.1 hypothetical protein AO364_0115 [Moraxella catarrhalis]RUO12152.1 hypothetical protein EJK49_0122 [Moraxella catarrhalis]
MACNIAVISAGVPSNADLINKKDGLTIFFVFVKYLLGLTDVK